MCNCTECEHANARCSAIKIYIKGNILHKSHFFASQDKIMHRVLTLQSHKNAKPHIKLLWINCK